MQDDFSEIHMHKLTLTKEGYRVDKPIRDVSDLETLQKECERVGILVRKLNKCILLPRVGSKGPGLIAANIFHQNGQWSGSLPHHTYETSQPSS